METDPVGRSSLKERLAWAWKRLRPLIGIALLAYVLCIVDWGMLLATIAQANGWLIAVAVFIELLTVVPRVLRWRALLITQGVRLPTVQLAGIYLIGSFFNNFLPSDFGGDSIRMLRVARATGQGADAVSSTVLERLLGMLATLTLGAVAVLANWQIASEGGVAIAVLAALGVFVLGLVLLFNLGGIRRWADKPKAQWLRTVAHKLADLYDSFHAFRHRRNTLALVTAYSMIYRLLMITGLYVQAMALGISIPFMWLVSAISLIAVVTAMPFSLNALGLKEGAYVFFFGLAGVAAPQAVALALLSRAVTLLISLIGGLLLLVGR